MLGRDEETLMVAARLREKRFVTLVGPGGVGKTTLAVAVGHDFGGFVKFVDFGALRDPGLVPTVVASTLGIPVQTEDPTPSLLLFLKHNPLFSNSKSRV
jgi:predicted ATPase